MSVDIEEILKIVRRQLGLGAVAADLHLQADLGAESVDLQGIYAALEDRFGVTLEDEDLAAIETVRDVHALVSSKVPEGD